MIPIDNRSYSWQSGPTPTLLGYLLIMFSCLADSPPYFFGNILPHLAGSEGASRASLCEEDAIAQTESASGPEHEYTSNPCPETMTTESVQA